MNLTKNYTIVAILLVLSLPLVARSESFGINTMDCPVHALRANKLDEISIIYTKRTPAISLETTLLEARAALATFWEKQLADSKNTYIEAIDLKMKGNIARLTALRAGAVTSSDDDKKALD